MVLAGAVLILVGLGLWLAGRAGLPLGRLPGDIHIERDRTSFHFPIVTCLLLSLALTLLLNLLLRLLHK